MWVNTSFEIEHNILKKDNGVEIIIGMDEVGRGPLSGPVVVGAVAFKLDDTISYPDDIWKINDSKKLSAKKREKLNGLIKDYALFHAIGSSTATEIDELGIVEAINLASDRAVKKMNIDNFAVIADSNLGNRKPHGSQFREYVLGGDGVSTSIAAASILAKVWRDALMKQITESENLYVYGWDKNSGYGTKQHREAILEHGMTKYHRKSFCSRIV